MINYWVKFSLVFLFSVTKFLYATEIIWNIDVQDQWYKGPKVKLSKVNVDPHRFDVRISREIFKKLKDFTLKIHPVKLAALFDSLESKNVSCYPNMAFYDKNWIKVKDVIYSKVYMIAPNLMQVVTKKKYEKRFKNYLDKNNEIDLIDLYNDKMLATNVGPIKEPRFQQGNIDKFLASVFENKTHDHINFAQMDEGQFWKSFLTDRIQYLTHTSMFQFDEIAGYNYLYKERLLDEWLDKLIWFDIKRAGKTDFYLYSVVCNKNPESIKLMKSINEIIEDIRKSPQLVIDPIYWYSVNPPPRFKTFFQKYWPDVIGGKYDNRIEEQKF